MSHRREASDIVGKLRDRVDDRRIRADEAEHIIVEGSRFVLLLLGHPPFPFSTATNRPEPCV